MNSLIKKLPPDTSQHAVRDITILTNSLFGRTHTYTFPKIFKVKNSILFWKTRGEQVVMYRSLKEYDRFSRVIGERYRRDFNYAKRIAQTLIEQTDWILNYIKQNKYPDKKFLLFYRDFFGYHQAVYWGGTYLSNLKSPTKKEKQAIKILDHAYQYNELVVPKVDAYFKKLKIDHLLYTEVISGDIKNKPKKRDLLFLDGRMHVLTLKQGNLIEKVIIKQNKKALKNIKEIKGLAVSKGRATGKVKIIKDLNKLGQCKSGDILVTTMTRPQFNAAIKKVKAIITDEGGLLCHASMLAREFKIPCIVGTKIATQTLKNGDKVEVDADHGIIKIL